jgi:hypothetical protein
MCGKSGVQLHAHHIIGRKAFAFRHDLSNGICLCSGCHTMSNWSWHKDRTKCLEWLKKNRPGQWEWFIENTAKKEKKVGNRTVTVYHAKKAEHRGDELEYEELKEI